MHMPSALVVLVNVPRNYSKHRARIGITRLSAPYFRTILYFILSYFLVGDNSNGKEMSKARFPSDVNNS